MNPSRTLHLRTRAGSWVASLLVVACGGGPGFVSGDCPQNMNCNGPVQLVPIVQPAYVTAQAGTAVTFTATDPQLASGLVTFQWYRSTDGGQHYVAIAGATQDTLTLSAVSLADDGALIQVTASASGQISGSAVAHLAVSAFPGITFADGEFQPADWTATALPDGSSPAATHAETQVATGGHPGSYRQMDVQLPAPSGVATVAHTSQVAVYDPATQGAVYVIDYAEEGLAPSKVYPKRTSSALLLEQGGRRYVATPPESYPAVSPIWSTSQNTASLHATDFSLRDGPACSAGESCPDFSALGAPMRFGYWRDTIDSPGAVVSHSIDNWKVTVWKR